jgi:dihydroneopterin triphosphate diphosphatase
MRPQTEHRSAVGAQRRLPQSAPPTGTAWRDARSLAIGGGVNDMTDERRFKIPESVLVVIHTKDLEVLLLDRSDMPGFWQSVTGSKDDADEPLEETCRREVGEETGIAIGSRRVHADCLRDWNMRNVYDIYPVWQARYAPGVTRNTEHVFGLVVPRDIEICLSPREHLRFEWLAWEDAADRCASPSNAEAILHLPRLHG